MVDIAPVDYGGSDEFEGYIEAMRGLDLSSVQRRADADEALAEAVPNRTVRDFLLQNLRREDDGWRWQANLEVARRASWPRSAAGRRSPWPTLAPYDGPVLWVAGADSGYVRPEYAEAMERWFPRHRRVSVKGAGHWVHSQQPEVFVEVLRRFVDSPDKR